MKPANMITPPKIHFFLISFLAWVFIWLKFFGWLPYLSTLIWLSKQFNAINLTAVTDSSFKKIPLRSMELISLILKHLKFGYCTLFNENESVLLNYWSF